MNIKTIHINIYRILYQPITSFGLLHVFNLRGNHMQYSKYARSLYFPSI